jgi:hypothetical protein
MLHQQFPVCPRYVKAIPVRVDRYALDALQSSIDQMSEQIIARTPKSEGDRARIWRVV